MRKNALLYIEDPRLLGKVRALLDNSMAELGVPSEVVVLDDEISAAGYEVNQVDTGLLSDIIEYVRYRKKPDIILTSVWRVGMRYKPRALLFKLSKSPYQRMLFSVVLAYDENDTIYVRYKRPFYVMEVRRGIRHFPKRK